MANQAKRKQGTAFTQAFRLAWNCITLRVSRSTLLVIGISLPITFIIYILSATTLLKASANAELINTTSSDLAVADNSYWFGALALLFSFIGIFNCCYLANEERLKEIATIKFLGASNTFVFSSLIFESLIIAFTGSVCGVIMGLFFAHISALIHNPWDRINYLTANEISYLFITGLVTGCIVYLAACILPALKAARFKTIEGLRNSGS